MLVATQTVSVTIVTNYICFSPPFTTAQAVVCTPYFHLVNLDCRFQMLNDTWKFIPKLLCLWTEVRLSYTELYDLRKTLSTVYKVKCSWYCTTLVSFTETSIKFLSIVCTKLVVLPYFGVTGNVLRSLIFYIICSRNAYFMMSIVTAASRVNDEIFVLLSLCYKKADTVCVFVCVWGLLECKGIETKNSRLECNYIITIYNRIYISLSGLIVLGFFPRTTTTVLNTDCARHEGRLVSMYTVFLLPIWRMFEK